MTAAFTILLPHKRNPGNDAALKITLDCLFTNTVNDFKLLIDAAENQPLYPRVNAMMRAATTDRVVYWSSDMFAAPGWDVPMLEAWTIDTIVTNVLVEPGAIGVYHENLEMDFGRKPETFRRCEFEEWCKTAPMLEGDGWVAPYLISRSAFLDVGGFREDPVNQDFQGFSGADELFFQEWKAAGKHVHRVRSYTYHLQRYSELEEQQAKKRN